MKLNAINYIFTLYARTSANWVGVKPECRCECSQINAHTSANWVGVKRNLWVAPVDEYARSSANWVGVKLPR